MQRELSTLEEYLGPLARGPGKLDLPDLPKNYLSPFTRNWNNHKHPDFIFTFWPVTEEYYSPLNALYLHELSHFREAHEHPHILSRDGLLPLLWFFENNPIPQTKTKLLVHERFQHFIPSAWWQDSGTYRLSGHPDRPFTWEKKTAPKRLLLHGIVTQNFIDLNYLKKRLDRMFALVEEKKLQIEGVDCFLIFRDDPYHWCETDQLVGQFMQEISTALKGQATFFSEKEIINKNSFANYEVFELNQMYFSADNYINFLTLTRGASLLESAPAKEGEYFVPQSPFHGFWVNPSPEHRPYSPEVQDYLEKMRGISLIDEKEERKNYWPRDFWLFAKALLEQAPPC